MFSHYEISANYSHFLLAYVILKLTLKRNANVSYLFLLSRSWFSRTTIPLLHNMFPGRYHTSFDVIKGMSEFLVGRLQIALKKSGALVLMRNAP